MWTRAWSPVGEAAAAAELRTAGTFGRAGREPSLAATRRYFSSFPPLQSWVRGDSCIWRNLSASFLRSWLWVSCPLHSRTCFDKGVCIRGGKSSSSGRAGTSTLLHRQKQRNSGKSWRLEMSAHRNIICWCREGGVDGMQKKPYWPFGEWTEAPLRV